MKKLALALLTICISVSVYGQKAKLQTASNYFRPPYEQYDKAKEAIDEVVLHEQTKGMAKSWYTRGMIYESLYKHAKYGELCDKCLMIAYESYQKAMELDPANEWAEEIKMARIPLLANRIFQEGVTAFQSKDYNKALADFELVQKISPTDTAVILNSAYSAERSGNTEKAKQYYSKLISLKYPDVNIYLSLSNLYKTQKDTSSALNTIMEGRALYPDTVSLLLAQINILLAGGKTEQATQALSEATTKDPNNPNLYLALGSSYDNLANPRADGKELPKPSNYSEYTTKAEDAYKKGLSISPDNYELNFNLGAMYFNQAAEMNNQANKLTDNNAYAKAKVKFEEKFHEAEPYLLKALDLNPRKSEDDISIYNGTLSSLKQLYAKTGETEKYNNIKAMMDGDK